MLKLHYTVAPDYTIQDVAFEGLTGTEYAGSLKAALTTMQIENPAEEFVQKVHNGDYDNISDEEYEALLATVKCMASLFTDPGEQGKTPFKREMNPLTLLGNALEQLVELDVALRRKKGRARK